MNILGLFLLATCVASHNLFENAYEYGETSFTVDENIESKIQEDMMETLLTDGSQQIDESDSILEELQEMIRMHEAQQMEEEWHTFHVSGTGYFKSSGIAGVWNNHGNSRWKMGHGVANVTQYSMQKTEALNNTYITVTYINTNYTGGKNSVVWTTATYTKTMMQEANKTLLLLSVALGASKGQLDISSIRRGVYKEEALTLVKNTIGHTVATVHSTNMGSTKASSRHISWKGTINGSSTEGDGVHGKGNHQHIPVHCPKKIHKAFTLTGVNSTFSSSYTGSVSRKHKIGRYHISVDQNSTAAGKTYETTVKAKGLYWKSDRYFKLEMHEVFNDWLTTVLEFIV